MPVCFHAAQSSALVIIFAMYLSSGKSSDNGAFGAVEINSILAPSIFQQLLISN
jgi:hypothetical protein